MKYFCLKLMFLAATLGLLAPSVLAADNIAVVVSKKSSLTRLTQAQVKSLYLGETRSPAPGITVEIHDRDRTSVIFKEFYQELAGMSPKQVSVHWARKVFTGEAPPLIRDSGDDAAVIEIIKSRPEAIIYIYEKNLNSSLKVLFSFPKK